ncbi:MAG TPA: response regulator transcription factor [Solirubrobacteraceae bacterium]|nr:response regulator transcription factor [Solirubrobacteraceae bacterium]
MSARQPSGEPDEPQTLRVAILDCDSGFLAVLTNRIERLGWQYRVLSARTTHKALASLQVDVLIVDLSLLGARRWKWLARQREQRPDVRVIVCAGASTVAERVCALRLGADDWLTKPCHPEELIARVEAVTSHRHGPEPRDLSPVIVGEVEIRPDLYQAFVHGQSVRLTRREYQLIELLSRAGNEIQPRDVIYECLWGYTMARNDRSVDVFIHKLRRKLECASPGWRYIHTHFGIGYRLGAERVNGGAELELQRAQESLVARLAA